MSCYATVYGRLLHGEIQSNDCIPDDYAAATVFSGPLPVNAGIGNEHGRIDPTLEYTHDRTC